MLNRSEWFAVLIALLVLGAGAFLSTYPTEVIRGVGFALIAIAIWGLIIWFMWERSHATAPALFLISVIVFAAPIILRFGAWYFWPSSSEISPEVLLDYSAAHLPEGNFDAEGHFAFPVLETFYGPNNSYEVAVVNFNGIPNSAVDWQRTIPEIVTTIYRIDITAIGGQPVFRVEISIEADFLESVPSPQPGTNPDMVFIRPGLIPSLQSGRVIETKPTKIEVRRVDPSRPFTLYAVNRTSAFVAAKILSKGTAQVTGGWRGRNIRITTNSVPWMAFMPSFHNY
jgi:hypothetical protein